MKKHYYIVDAHDNTLSFYKDSVVRASLDDANLKYDLISQAIDMIDRLNFLKNDNQLIPSHVKFPLHVEYIGIKYVALNGISAETLNALQEIYETIKYNYATDHDEIYQAYTWWLSRFSGVVKASKAASTFIEQDALEQYREYDFERNDE